MVKTITTSKPKLASIAKSETADHTDAFRSEFTAAAIGMSWQLAVIVIIGIMGGYKLDTITGRSPIFTLVGLVVALVASILVIRRALSRINNFDVANPKSAVSNGQDSRAGTYDDEDES